MSKHPHAGHHASEPHHPKPQKPVHALSPAHSKAVLECARTITSLEPPAPADSFSVIVPDKPASLVEQEAQLRGLQAELAHARTHKAKKALQGNIARIEHALAPRRHFWNEVQAIEDQSNVNLYTPRYYQAQLERAKDYTDAYVDALPKDKLPAGGKGALKNKFHVIIEGAAGMGTGWDPKTVMGAAARRPHTGVFQTSWEFIQQARGEFRHYPAMEAALNHPNSRQDLAVLNLGSQLHTAHGLPTTSFAGQGAAFAGMAVASYERFIAGGGRPNDFNGIIVYEDHMTGPTGANRFRNTLEGPQHKGDPGVADATYDGNYLITAHPYAGVNDLNPSRLVHGEATAHEVYGMLRDKFIHARNKLDATPDVSPGRVKAFEEAFLPEWSKDAELKEHDIARVKYQHDSGHALRAEAKDYALRLAVEQYNAGHRTQKPITLEQAQAMGLNAPEHPGAGQKEELCSILLKPIAPFNPRISTPSR